MNVYVVLGMDDLGEGILGIFESEAAAYRACNRLHDQVTNHDTGDVHWKYKPWEIRVEEYELYASGDDLPIEDENYYYGPSDRLDFEEDRAALFAERERELRDRATEHEIMSRPPVGGEVPLPAEFVLPPEPTYAELEAEYYGVKSPLP